MHLHQVPWFRAFLVYITLVVLFLVYGHSMFYRDPGSMFFDSTRAFTRRYSAYRESETNRFLSELSQDNSFQRHPKSVGDHPTLCASFLSRKRQGNQYLPLALASALQGLSSCERNDLHVDVLIAHTNTSDHPSTHLAWLSSLVDNAHGYNMSAEQIKMLQTLEEKGDFSAKAVHDYTYALNTCYQVHSEWIVVLEDDVLFADGWLVRTKQAVEKIQRELTQSSNNWLFLRLFNQERSIGWASHTIGGNHEIPISAALIIVTFAAISFIRQRSRIYCPHLDNGTSAVICLLGIPTFVVLFFKAGKASLLPPRPGVHRENFGCCSQGLVFPRNQIPRVIQYLTARERGQIDMMLDELADRDHLDRYALYPVQLQHIGQRSVRGTTTHEAQAIWSMAFESQNPSELHDAHSQLLQSMYGEECTLG